MNLMKTKFSTIAFLLIATIGLLVTSCKKEDTGCTVDPTGTYVGNESCTGSNTNLTFVITNSSVENEVVFSLSGTQVTFKGTKSADCKTISIPNQNIPNLGSLNGSFNLNGTTLTGSLTYAFGVCTYNMVKQ